MLLHRCDDSKLSPCFLSTSYNLSFASDNKFRQGTHWPRTRIQIIVDERIHPNDTVLVSNARARVGWRALGTVDVLGVTLTCSEYSGCITMKRRRAFKGNEVQNSPLYLQMLVPRSWLLTFYPFYFGPLNDMRIVNSQCKIIYPSPKFISCWLKG